MVSSSSKSGGHRETMARARQTVDIRVVIGRVVELRKRSKRWWGDCPFHDEKTGSFLVDDDAQGRFHCFGCNADGDVVDFLARIEGVSLGEAGKRLLDLAGEHTRGDSPRKLTRGEQRERRRGRAKATFARLANRLSLCERRYIAASGTDSVWDALEAREKARVDLFQFFLSGNFMPLWQWEDVAGAFGVVARMTPAELAAHGCRAADFGGTKGQCWDEWEAILVVDEFDRLAATIIGEWYREGLLDGKEMREARRLALRYCGIHPAKEHKRLIARFVKGEMDAKIVIRRTTIGA